MANAQLYFDTVNGSTWNTSSTNWSTTSGGPYNTSWVNGQGARFEGTAAMVTMSAGLSASSLGFSNASGIWRLGTGSLTLSGVTTPTIDSGTGTTSTSPRIDTSLTASAGFTKVGSRSLELRGTQSGVQGTVNISEGALLFGAVTAGSANALWDLTSSTSTLQGRAAGTISLGALSGVSNSTLNAASGAATVFEVGALGTSTAFNGNVANGSGGATVGLTKIGAGTLTLNGTNSYTSATNINAGVLRVNGTLGNTAVTVNAGGTLAGSGAITGSVTVNDDGILSAGNSPGNLDTGAQVWNGGGIVVWEINNVPGAGGTAGNDPGWDLFNINGGLTINASAGNEFIIRVTSLTLTNAAGDAANFDSNLNYIFLLADTTAEIATYDASDFIIDTSAFSNSFGGVWGVARGDTVGGANTQLYITYSIPEPGIAMLMGVASGLTIRRRRRAIGA